MKFPRIITTVAISAVTALIVTSASLCVHTHYQTDQQESQIVLSLYRQIGSALAAYQKDTGSTLQGTEAINILLAKHYISNTLFDQLRAYRPMVHSLSVSSSADAPYIEFFPKKGYIVFYKNGSGAFLKRDSDIPHT